MRWMVALGFLAAVGVQAQTVETGTLGGAEYRVDVPANWNHSLVVFYHGYSEKPTHFSKGPAAPGYTLPFLGRGFAVVESGFSVTGWALPQAFAETEMLRQKFVKDHGQPTETYVTGESMGGALTMMTFEKNPGPYNGALDLCGAVLPANEWSQRRFALLAAFEFYFPGVLPELQPTPVDYVETEPVHQKVLAALASKPKEAVIIRLLTGLYTDEYVAHLMQYVVYQASDFARKAGGSVVDTRNWIYTGTGSAEGDFALNNGVKRYSADPVARKWMVENYSATGHVVKPMLAVHTVVDNLIPAGSLELYAERVAEAGNADRFVQQYVDRVGHCAFTNDEIGRAFDELLGWVHGGAKPLGGKLP
jgi:pimeloyl-ACP methyl ester carboxylesterase